MNVSGTYVAWAAAQMKRTDKTNEVWNKLFLFENTRATEPADRIPLIIPVAIGRKHFMGMNVNMIPNAKNKELLLKQLVKLAETKTNKKSYSNAVTKALQAVIGEFGYLGMIKTYMVDNKTIRQGRWASVSYQEALDHYAGY